MLTTTSTICPTPPSHPPPSPQAHPVPALPVALNLTEATGWAGWMTDEGSKAGKATGTSADTFCYVFRLGLPCQTWIQLAISFLMVTVYRHLITNIPRSHIICCPISRLIFRKFGKKLQANKYMDFPLESDECFPQWVQYIKGSVWSV